MARQQRDQTFDLDFRLKDAGAITADAAAQVGGSNKIQDLGASRIDGRVIVDITAMDAVTGDEEYFIKIQFSSASDFASGVVNGPCLHVGDATQTGESADTPLGRFELPFTNEYNGTVYRYMRVYTDVEGTTPSINYVANGVLR